MPPGASLHFVLLGVWLSAFLRLLCIRKDVKSGFVPAAVPPIPCIFLNPWRSEQPGSVTSTVPEKTVMNFFSRMFAGSRVPESVAREYTSIKFLWSKSLPDHGVIFEEVSEQDLQPGDIVLFPMMSSYKMCSKVFQHAAVYCRDGEVIHFLVGSDTTSLGQISGFTYEGMIVKSGFIALKNKRGKCKIYRKKGGVNRNDLDSEVEKAMNSEAKYSLYKNNCIHFALSLLGLEEFYSELVQIQDEGDSSRSGGAKNHIHGEISEKGPERNLPPGNIVSFPLESSSEKHSNVFKHAAVYCGSGEVAKFQDSGTQSTEDLISSQKCRGEIVRARG
nr:uncharacterized protein LOC102099049 [Columba livia]XP_021136991.1 uncharacterized protein LOC102099049 [Columba livia]